MSLLSLRGLRAKPTAYRKLRDRGTLCLDQLQASALSWASLERRPTKTYAILAPKPCLALISPASPKLPQGSLESGTCRVSRVPSELSKKRAQRGNPPKSSPAQELPRPRAPTPKSSPAQELPRPRAPPPKSSPAQELPRLRAPPPKSSPAQELPPAKTRPVGLAPGPRSRNSL
ncbi:swi5-dependent recombination DNA repair protein 1 homolog [Penaeus indicus]|uniref:swi5-dependent recombination DNA repair protein 1 homolog n=1 Tax=Penaeus indicus TaxID=29960 RepID=UPI00300CB9A3